MITAAELQAIKDFVQAVGVLGLLVVILWTGARGSVWIFTKVRDDERRFSLERLDDMRKDRDEWKALAQRTGDILDQQTGQMEKLVDSLEHLASAASKQTPKA